MDAHDFVSTIEARLKAARGLDLRYCEGLAVTADTEVQALAEKLTAYLGEPPTEAMRRRLAMPRHFKLYWEAAIGKPPGANGEVSLYNVADALIEQDFSSLNYAENPDLAFLDTYRILDDHPYIGDGNLAVIGLNDAFTDVNLFHMSEYKLYPLALSFDEYVDCVATTLGYTHWQFLFCKGLPATRRRHARGPYRKKLRADLQRLWPELDLAAFDALVDRAA
jgi:hypothetical protein